MNASPHTLPLLLCGMLMCGSAQAQIIVAHRGASYDAPENTLAAFELAWAQGADGVEGDFYLTADHQIVCIHDADTERTTGVKKLVAETTLRALRQLDAGSWKDPKWRDQRLPTLREVLATVPAGKKMVIELKTDARIVPVLAQQLRQLPPTLNPENILIISFHEDAIAACKQQLPHIRAHWLTGFKQSKASGKWSPSVQQIASTVRQCGADGVGMKGEPAVVDAALIDRLSELGCDEFHVWTIDDPALARRFQQLGAYGITTNRPALIRQSLQR